MGILLQEAGIMFSQEFADEIAKKYGKTEKDLPQAAKGLAALILKDKTNYQYFGAYWWAVKELIAEYYPGKAWFKNGYMDDIAYNRAWHGSQVKTISAAVHYQHEQIMKTPSHFVIINGEDESYTLYDEDAGF